MKELLGLAVLAWPLTLLVLIALAFVVVITVAVAYAARTGRSKWRWALAGFLLVYLPIFWDWIPTVVAHKYYCATEAGFWVYKTLEQWKQENPGVAETLVANKGDPHKFEGDMNNYTTTHFQNSHFNLIVRHNGKFLFNRWRHEQEVVDTKTGEVLARYIDFSTSQERRQAGWSGWKFWLDSRDCTGGREQASNFIKFFEEIKGTEK